ncbi:MAG TPA: MauE/DoxX family redox-associated membrane protein [Actinomycetota bacterium]|nr:MauE/DoxX family redox-associated membrane protein [Actinomycetota bacterium]
MSELAIFSATALSVILVVAAGGKLGAPDRFRRALTTYRVIPKAAIPFLVVVVPVTELALAALQWVRPLQPVAGLAITGMFVVFTLLLLRSLLAGEEADCGCFGSAAPEKVSWFSVLRNVVLIGLALAGAFAGGDSAASTLAPVLAGIGAGLLILVVDQALTVFSRTWFTPDRLGS